MRLTNKQRHAKDHREWKRALAYADEHASSSKGYNDFARLRVADGWKAGYEAAERDARRRARA